MKNYKFKKYLIIKENEMTENLLSKEAISHILNLKKDIIIKHEDMGKNLNVTVFPHEGNVNESTREFFCRNDNGKRTGDR